MWGSVIDYVKKRISNITFSLEFLGFIKVALKI